MVTARQEPSREEGAAAVEFALVIIPLIVLLFGIVEVGFLLFAQGTLAGAAREGVRFYALQPTRADIDSLAADEVRDAAFGLRNPGTIAVSFDANCGADPGSEVIVTVKYTFTSLTGLLWRETELTAVGSMRCTG